MPISGSTPGSLTGENSIFRAKSTDASTKFGTGSIVVSWAATKRSIYRRNMTSETAIRVGETVMRAGKILAREEGQERIRLQRELVALRQQSMHLRQQNEQLRLLIGRMSERYMHLIAYIETLRSWVEKRAVMPSNRREWRGPGATSQSTEDMTARDR